MGYAAFFHQVKWTSTPPMHQLAVLSMGWVAFFSSSLNQYFFWFLINEFFWGLFFLNPDLHTTFPPSYLIDMAILLTYILVLPTNKQLNSLLVTYVLFFHWLNFYPLCQNLYLFLVKPLLLSKTYISLCSNLHLLVKYLFFFWVKPPCFLFLSTNFYLSSAKVLPFLTKFPYIDIFFIFSS
jgi:hypothetical protein